MPRRKRLTTEQLVEALINRMFEIAGHDVRYVDIKDRKDNWYQQYTMTMAQRNEWVTFGEKLIKENTVMGKYNSEKEMRFFDLMYGLKVSDHP